MLVAFGVPDHVLHVNCIPGLGCHHHCRSPLFGASLGIAKVYQKSNLFDRTSSRKNKTKWKNRAKTNTMPVFYFSSFRVVWHRTSPQDEGARKVLGALGSSVQYLEMSQNNLTDAVAEDMAAFIVDNVVTLDILLLGGNKFESCGAKLVRAPASRSLWN